MAGRRRTPAGSDAARPSAEAATLRVLTLNAHQGVGGRHRRGLLAGIRAALRASAADLVFLQEIGGDIGAEDDQEHCEMLADEVWPQFAYGRNAVAGDGHQGNGVLSKYPIARWQNLDVSVGRAERRGMLHCVIDVPHPRGPLHAVCVHLGLRESHRRRQVDGLVEFITHQVPADAPLIAAGDFNDWSTRSHRRLARIPGVEEICSGELGSPARTFPAWCPVLRLDRIYVRNIRHKRLALPAASWSGLSDHVPLAGEVSL